MSKRKMKIKQTIVYHNIQQNTLQYTDHLRSNCAADLWSIVQSEDYISERSTTVRNLVSIWLFDILSKVDVEQYKIYRVSECFCATK